MTSFQSTSHPTLFLPVRVSTICVSISPCLQCCRICKMDTKETTSSSVVVARSKGGYQKNRLETCNAGLIAIFTSVESARVHKILIHLVQSFATSDGKVEQQEFNAHKATLLCNVAEDGKWTQRKLRFHPF